jgi:hypothetical protein
MNERRSEELNLQKGRIDRRRMLLTILVGTLDLLIV